MSWSVKGYSEATEAGGVLKAMSKARIHLKGDERILGESDFVKKVLADYRELVSRPQAGQ